jgi:hypothetical protein
MLTTRIRSLCSGNRVGNQLASGCPLRLSGLSDRNHSCTGEPNGNSGGCFVRQAKVCGGKGPDRASQEGKQTGLFTQGGTEGGLECDGQEAR